MLPDCQDYPHHNLWNTLQSVMNNAHMIIEKLSQTCWCFTSNIVITQLSVRHKDGAMFMTFKLSEWNAYMNSLTGNATGDQHPR